MKKFLTLFTLLALLFFQGTLKAQSNDTECSLINFDLGTDLVSRYVWRGTQFGGNGPSIQPYTSLAIKNFEFGAWGAYSLDGLNTGQEFDLYLTYTFANDMVSATVTDYFFPDFTTDYNYFDYAAPTTGHILEATLSFNGTESFPLTVLAAVNFFGADAKKLNTDLTEAGLQYSNYFELGYEFSVSSVSVSPFVGFTLSNPDTDLGETGFYGSKAGVVNAGFSFSKEIKITDNFSLPISSSVIANPDTKKMFFVLGISF